MMAYRILQATFHYKTLNIDKTRPLGNGAYGAVYKAKYDQLTCAAKIVHPTILHTNDPGSATIMERFLQECRLLGDIRHPNIVQYLGFCEIAEVGSELSQPVLLMELLDESLTKMLDCSQQQPLPYHVEVDICHDISLAIAYLHSNNVLHRDLSGNNVLITGGRKAKVTDFGMVKLARLAHANTPLTNCPGTPEYMPPEAFLEPPLYSEKLDCFSEGVIMIQICTRLYPKPGPRTELVPDAGSPTGTAERPVLETERRKDHIDLIRTHHPLGPIALECLKYENKRPTSEDLCMALARFKESRDYRNSVQEILDKEVQIRLLQQELQEKGRALHDVHQQYNQMLSCCQQMEHVIREKDGTLQEKDRAIQVLEQQSKGDLAILERELRQQLTERDQIIGEIERFNHSLQVQLQQLQQERRMVSWRRCNNVPCDEFTSPTCAVVDKSVAYFMGKSGRVCFYDLSCAKWNDLCI